MYIDPENSRIKPYDASVEETLGALSEFSSSEDLRIGEWRISKAPPEIKGFIPPVREVKVEVGGTEYQEFALLMPGRVRMSQNPLQTLGHALSLAESKDPVWIKTPPHALIVGIVPEDLKRINSASFSGYSLDPEYARVLGIMNGDGHIAGAIEYSYAEGFGNRSERPLVEVAYAIDPEKREKGLATTALARVLSLAYGTASPETKDEEGIAREFLGRKPVFYADCLHESSNAVAINAARLAGLPIGAGAHLSQLGVVCLGKDGSPICSHGNGRYITTAAIFVGDNVRGTDGLKDAISFSEKYWGAG